MSESSEKRFDPTPSRIAKAKREGNIARSQELGANSAFLSAAGSVAAIAPSLAGVATQAMRGAAQGHDVSAECTLIASYGAIVICAGAIGGALASIVQAGGLSFVAPVAKLERLAPGGGIKRMFSKETASHALRGSVAFAVASAAAACSITPAFAAGADAANVSGIAAVAWNASLHVAYAAGGIGLAFAALEFAVARRAWLEKLKMSLHELKREHKENDGDPIARQRRRAMHRTLIRGALSAVKKAAFVVVNPTHVAVALEYAPPAVPVPRILVRAADEMALRVREEAARVGVPVIENVTLARALFAQTEVGEPIPSAHFVAIAEIVARLVRSGVLR